MANYNVGINPFINDNTGHASVSAGVDLSHQMPNLQNKACFKLIKKMKGSQQVVEILKDITSQVDVICKSFAEMPPKLELLRLKQEFINLGELGALNASIEDLSGSDFKVSFIHNGSLVEIYYKLIKETEYSTTQYDPMI